MLSLGARQKGQEGLKGATVDNDLGLDIITRHDVTDRAKGGSLDSSHVVHQQFNETTANSRLDNGLDLFVGAIREVGHGPASIDQHFIIIRVDQFGKDRESRADLES